MSTQKQLMANRENAKKSTGPRTQRGKAMVATNALRHGVTSQVAVVPLLEQQEDWEAHRQGVLENLVPFGHLETVLAERVAALLWRLGRATRFETEIISNKQQKLSSEVFGIAGASMNPETLQLNLQNLQEVARILKRLPQMADSKKVRSVAASEILEALLDCGEGSDLDDISLSGIPEDVSIDEFDQWAAGLVRELIKGVAHQLGRSFEDLLSATKAEISRQGASVKENLINSNCELDRARRQHLLPSSADLDKISRYESHLERSLYKALHELQRIQAARQGQVQLPIAVDVNGPFPGETV